MKNLTIKTEQGHEVRVSDDGQGMCVLRCVTSAGTVAHKLPAWVVQALMGEDAVQPERASAEEVRDYVSRLTQPEPAGNSCLYIDEDCDPPRPCRRRGGHSGPHTSSLNEARRLDAVVTHEDLKKLRDELIEALEEVTVDRPHKGFGGVVEVPAGFRELAQLLREKRR